MYFYRLEIEICDCDSDNKKDHESHAESLLPFPLLSAKEMNIFLILNTYYVPETVLKALHLLTQNLCL